MILGDGWKRLKICFETKQVYSIILITPYYAFRKQYTDETSLVSLRNVFKKVKGSLKLFKLQFKSEVKLHRCQGFGPVLPWFAPVSVPVSLLGHGPFLV